MRQHGFGMRQPEVFASTTFIDISSRAEIIIYVFSSCVWCYFSTIFEGSFLRQPPIRWLPHYCQHISFRQLIFSIIDRLMGISASSSTDSLHSEEPRFFSVRLLITQPYAGRLRRFTGRGYGLGFIVARLSLPPRRFTTFRMPSAVFRQQRFRFIRGFLVLFSSLFREGQPGKGIFLPHWCRQPVARVRRSFFDFRRTPPFDAMS